MINRPGMQEMLNFLKKKKPEQTVVIIDDISRLARGLEAHIQLRTAIGDSGGKLESPSIEFGDDSDSRLVENLLASVSQHQKQKNAEQVRNRMRARVMNGYWPLRAPIGYRHERTSGHLGKVLVRDEPLASIVQEALKGYASGRFETQSEVKHFLESFSEYPRDRKGEVHYQRVYNLLNRVIYAGYIDRPEWGLNLHPAKHEPLISFEEWKKIQGHLNGQSKAPARKDLNVDFPLRGFVTCGNCNQAMTACWSAGRYKKYPYYLCSTKGCSDYRKSIRKEQIESEFEVLLDNLRPSQNLFFMAMDLFKEFWEENLKKSVKQGKLLKLEIGKIEKKVEQFLDLIIEEDNITLIKTYKKKLRNLEEEKVSLNEKAQNCGSPLQSFEETFRTAFGFLANPYKLWTSNRLQDKRTVLRLAFSERLPYYRNEGFRTASTSLPCRLLGNLKGGEYDLVSREEIEPSTY